MRRPDRFGFASFIVGLCLFIAPLALDAGEGWAGSTSSGDRLFEQCCPVDSTAIGWVVGFMKDTNVTLLHTTDGGGSWTRQGLSDDFPKVSLESVAAIDDCNAWVVGDSSDGYGVIMRTTDGGQSWVRQGQDPLIPDVSLFGVYAVNSQTAWVVGDEGVILHTINGGQDWTQQGQDTAPQVMLTGVYAANGCKVWVVGYMDSGYGTILYSDNGGQGWHRQVYTPDPGIVEPYLITCHGYEDQTIWAVGRGNSLRSTDDQTWADHSPGGGIGTYDLNGIQALDADTAWMVADSNGIYRYDGSQWNQQTAPLQEYYYLLRISAMNSQSAWIIGQDHNYLDRGGVILHTSDGGQNWVVQDPGINAPYAGVSFLDTVPNAQ